MQFPSLLTADGRQATDTHTGVPVTAEALCAEVPRLRRLVHRLLGFGARGHDLDDLVQDVLLKAWQKRARFRGDAQLSTWLVAIALSTVKDHVRRRTVRQRLFGWLLPADLAATTGGDPANEPLDATTEALQRLAHQDREVLVLRYLEQRGIDEVARLLGITRTAVDQRLSRARQRLRGALGLVGPGDAP